MTRPLIRPSGTFSREIPRPAKRGEGGAERRGEGRDYEAGTGCRASFKSCRVPSDRIASRSVWIASKRDCQGDRLKGSPLGEQT